jgi:hypothetical protein
MAHGARLGTVVMFVQDLDRGRKEDLERAEGVLRGRSAHRQTRSSGEVVAVQGRGGAGPWRCRALIRTTSS